MVRNGEIKLTDAKRVFRRYWWIMPTVVVLCGVIGVVAALVLPKRYTSQTTVLVEQPSVPEAYVKPVVTEDLSHRLATMQEQILSRTRLQPIIDKFGLYASDRGSVHIDDLVERLRSAISLKPIEPMQGTQQNRQLPGFYIIVNFDTAQMAQQICTEITSMFLEQNAREREQQATRTTTFLGGQLDEAKKKLDDQDAKLARFKMQYLGSLPQEEQANLSLLNGMNSQLDANTQALSRAHQDKVFTETLLSQQEANWKATKAGSNSESADQQLSLLQEQLTSLQGRYTPEHPDVIKVKNQIAELQKRAAETPNAKVVGTDASQVSAHEPPQIQQLRAKVRQDDLNIADLTRQQAQIQAQTRQLQGRVQSSPIVEQQFKELTRNYQTALDFYNELLKKRENSAMATNLEHQQQSEQFRVYDPPSLPDKPSFPKMPNFAGVGLGAGLALGLAILFLLAISDKSIYTEQDAEFCLKLPVLAAVPTLAVGKSNGSNTPREYYKEAVVFRG